MHNKRVKKKMSKMERREQVQFWALCLPSLLKVLLFSYIPMIWLTMAFQFYIPRRVIMGSEWVGFENFDYLLKSEIRQNIERKEVVKNVLTNDSKETVKTSKKSTKVGRNDACPCGSGKKYKMCCGK